MKVILEVAIALSNSIGDGAEAGERGAAPVDPGILSGRPGLRMRLDYVAEKNAQDSKQSPFDEGAICHPKLAVQLLKFIEFFMEFASSPDFL